MSDESTKDIQGWQPRITAFVCRWCTYAGADLAGTSRLKYPPQIRIVKLPCTGRIDTLFILRAFAMGSDGVLVSGCHPGDCHYTSGNYVARRRFSMTRELLHLIGLEPERLHFSWVSAAEGAKFVEVVKGVTEAVRSVGPFAGFGREATAPPYATAATAANEFPTLDLRQPRGARETTQRAVSEASLFKAAVSEAKADLESGVVRAVLGHRAGRQSGALHPVWVKNAAALNDLQTSSDGKPVLAPYLVRRLREDPEGAYGILAGPYDRAALEVLEAEQQVDPARIRVYVQEGITAGPSVEAGAVPGMDRSPRERRDFWTNAFESCLRCYACREACPLCSCVRCVADKTRPRWIDASPTPAGNWLWNVTRAYHQAGRCVECGSCTEACPVGIPLSALGAHLNRIAEREFGPRAKDEKGRRSPLVSFRIEDEAPFIL